MITEAEFGEKLDNLVGDALVAGIDPKTINRMLEAEKLSLGKVIRSNPQYGNIEIVDEK